VKRIGHGLKTLCRGATKANQEEGELTMKVYYSKTRSCWAVQYRNQLWYFKSLAAAQAFASK